MHGCADTRTLRTCTHTHMWAWVYSRTYATRVYTHTQVRVHECAHTRTPHASTPIHTNVSKFVLLRARYTPIRTSVHVYVHGCFPSRTLLYTRILTHVGVNARVYFLRARNTHTHTPMQMCVHGCTLHALHTHSHRPSRRTTVNWWWVSFKLDRIMTEHVYAT